MQRPAGGTDGHAEGDARVGEPIERRQARDESGGGARRRRPTGSRRNSSTSTSPCRRRDAIARRRERRRTSSSAARSRRRISASDGARHRAPRRRRDPSPGARGACGRGLRRAPASRSRPRGAVRRAGRPASWSSGVRAAASPALRRSRRAPANFSAHSPMTTRPVTGISRGAHTPPCTRRASRDPRRRRCPCRAPRAPGPSARRRGRAPLRRAGRFARAGPPRTPASS